MPKEFLKMADVFRNEMRVVGDSNNIIADDVGIIIGCYSGDKMAEHVLHAINSHDELVRLRDELLAALEAHEKFWTIREAELGELSPEAKAVRDNGLAAIAAAKEAE